MKIYVVTFNYGDFWGARYYAQSKEGIREIIKRKCEEHGNTMSMCDVIDFRKNYGKATIEMYGGGSFTELPWQIHQLDCIEDLHPTS